MKQTFFSSGDGADRQIRQRLLEITTGTALEMVGRAGSETVLLPHRRLDRWRPERDVLVPPSPPTMRFKTPRLSLMLSGQGAIGSAGSICEMLSGDFAVHPRGVDVFEAGLPGVPAFEQLWIAPELSRVELQLSTFADGAISSVICPLAYPPGHRTTLNPEVLKELAVEVELDRKVGLRAALLRILHGVIQALLDAPVAAAPGWNDPLVKRVMVWMEQEPPGRWRVSLAARAMGCSRATLTRRFRACVGEPLSTFARRQRMRHVELLLSGTTWPLNRIARECGFSDEAHLSHVCVREIGMTPGTFRCRAADRASGLG